MDPKQAPHEQPIDNRDPIVSAWLFMLRAFSWEGVARLKFLVDTNILIAIEPVQTELEPTARVATELA
jgi:hypothetical protein